MAPGLRLIDSPQFPADWKPEALAQIEALQLFRASTGGVEWSYVSPPAIIEPGRSKANTAPAVINS